jgi:hypothetical protein
MKLFVDMDGVLADFDSHHGAVFGFRPDRILDNVDWDAVDRVKDFFLNIPPMPDLKVLWDFVSPLQPIVLTGVPSAIHVAADNKRAWVRRHLGAHVEVRCCPSKEKCLHAQASDILVDDWEKYRHLWEAKGGRWITHTSAENTIQSLMRLGIG